MLSCARPLTMLSEETQRTVIDQGRALFVRGALDDPGTQWAALIRKLERESISDWRVWWDYLASAVSVVIWVFSPYNAVSRRWRRGAFIALTQGRSWGWR